MEPDESMTATMATRQITMPMDTQLMIREIQYGSLQQPTINTRNVTDVRMGREQKGVCD
jgi:hypothetical protein